MMNFIAGFLSGAICLLSYQLAMVYYGLPHAFDTLNVIVEGTGK